MKYTKYRIYYAEDPESMEPSYIFLEDFNNIDQCMKTAKRYLKRYKHILIDMDEDGD